MHEKPRFGIALAGVGGCLCIAAGIVMTTPRGIAVPSVDGLPAARAESLPRLPMPAWSEVAASATPTGPGSRVQGTPASHAPSRVGVGAPRADGATAAPAVLNRQSSLVTRQSSIPLMLSDAPHTSGTDVVVADAPADERGPVTGALVTAGTHIGDGFRTAGRTLKRVF